MSNHFKWILKLDSMGLNTNIKSPSGLLRKVLAVLVIDLINMLMNVLIRYMLCFHNSAKYLKMWHMGFVG